MSNLKRMIEILEEDISNYQAQLHHLEHHLPRDELRILLCKTSISTLEQLRWRYKQIICDYPKEVE